MSGPMIKRRVCCMSETAEFMQTDGTNAQNIHAKAGRKLSQMPADGRLPVIRGENCYLCRNVEFCTEKNKSAYKTETLL